MEEERLPASEEQAVLGLPAQRVATTPLGGTTLRIESREGSVIGTFAIRNVDPRGVSNTGNNPRGAKRGNRGTATRSSRGRLHAVARCAIRRGLIATTVGFAVAPVPHRGTAPEPALQAQIESSPRAADLRSVQPEGEPCAHAELLRIRPAPQRTGMPLSTGQPGTCRPYHADVAGAIGWATRRRLLRPFRSELRG